MLGKLMKHEFRATGRVGAPLCGIMLALSVAAGVVLRYWKENESGWREQAGSTVIILYGISVFAVAIGIFVVLMQHFKKNLLGDEGYLMRTLPVSVHELLLSKLFVALLWYAASMLLIALSFLFVGMLSGVLDASEFAALREALLRELSELDASFLLRAALGFFGSMALMTLLFYADFTLSQTFSKHKILYNVAGVVIFILLLRLLLSVNGFLSTALFSVSANGGNVTIVSGADGPTAFFSAYGPSSYLWLIELYVSNVLLYFLTWAFLKYRPNIE